MFQGMSIVFLPSFILLAVGIMIATWLAGGIVPALIWYGLKLLNPGLFYAAACLVCALVSLSIGSSWTTAATGNVRCCTAITQPSAVRALTARQAGTSAATSE